MPPGVLDQQGEVDGQSMLRALSPLEKVFWRLAEAAPLNVTAIARVTGPLDQDVVRSALADLQERHPLLRVRIESALPAPKYRAEGVSQIPLRLVDGSPDWHVVAEDEINKPIDWATGPLIRCTCVLHAGPSHDLLLTFHHVIGDGMSGAFLMRDLLQRCALRLGASCQPIDRLHDSLPLDARLPTSANGLWGTWNMVRFLARVAGEDLRFGLPARVRAEQEAALGECTTRIVGKDFDRDFVAALTLRAREQRTTVHGALSAAICLATAHDAGSPRPLSVKHRSPVNVRQQLDPRANQDVGMFASMAFFRGRVLDTDDFWTLARRVRASIQRQVESGTPGTLIRSLPQLYRLLGGDAVSAQELGRRWRHRTPTTTGLTNLGRLDFATHYGPLAMTTLHFVASPGALGDFTCTATSFNGSLRWNFVCAEPVFSQERIQGLAQDAVRRLEQAVGGASAK